MNLKLSFFAILFLIWVHVDAQRGAFSADVLFGSSIYTLSDYEQADFDQKFNYSYGLYLKHNIKINNSILSIRSGFFINTKKYSRSFQDTASWLPQQINSSLTYSNIPLQMELKFNVKDKYYPFICIGIVFSKIISEEQNVILNSGVEDDSFLNRSSLLENPNFLNISFGTEFKMSKIIYPRIELFLSQQTNEGSPSNRDRFGNFSFGIILGFSFDFIFKELKRSN